MIDGSGTGVIITFSTDVDPLAVDKDRFTLHQDGSESNPDGVEAYGSDGLRLYRDGWTVEPGNWYAIDQTLPFLLPPNPTLTPPGVITGTLT